jgi:putative effector of murein hydrolase
MIDPGKLSHLQGALVWLPSTIVLYAGSSALHRRLDKAPIANPTLLTIAALVLILAGCGIPYKTYFESVAVLHYLLGTAVVALAVPLYRNANRLHGRCISMAVALVAGSLASISSGLSSPRSGTRRHRPFYRLLRSPPRPPCRWRYRA